MESSASQSVNGIASGANGFTYGDNSGNVSRLVLQRIAPLGCATIGITTRS